MNVRPKNILVFNLFTYLTYTYLRKEHLERLFFQVVVSFKKVINTRKRKMKQGSCLHSLPIEYLLPV